MLVKQIDRAEAFRLANNGMEIKILIPGPEGTEWEEAHTTTLSKLLDGCVFFRPVPAAVNPDFEAAVQSMEATAAASETAPPDADGAAAGTAGGTEKPSGKRVGTGGKRKQVDVGKMFALKKAGWSQVKIADELGVSEATVSAYLKKGEQDGEKL